MREKIVGFFSRIFRALKVFFSKPFLLLQLVLLNAAILVTVFLVQRPQSLTGRASREIVCSPIELEPVGQKPDLEKQKTLPQLLEKSNLAFYEKANEELKRGEEKLSDELKGLASERKSVFVQTMRSNPEKALTYLLPEEQREKLGQKLGGCVEEPFTVEGTLEIKVADFFEDNLATTHYLLVTDDGSQFVLHPARSLKDPLESRTKVKVKGYKFDQEILFDGSASFDQPSSEGTGIEVLEQPGNPPVLGEERVAVILVNFQNTPLPASPTRDEERNFVNSSITNYYTENSYGKVHVTGDAFGWYTLALDQSCDINAVWSEAVRVADNDIYYPSYGRIVVIAPYGPNCGGWAGMGTIGKASLTSNDGRSYASRTEIIVTWARSLYIFGHELGHNFGVHHASFLDCGDASLAASGCTTEEYGDRYDIMGSPNTFHFNAAFKEYVGWLDSSEIKLVEQSGSFMIIPIETTFSGIKALKIRINNTATGYLYIEYRYPMGFDNLTNPPAGLNVYNGALLHTLVYANKTGLIDPSPLIDDNLITISLLPGQTFIEPTSGSRIYVNSVTPLGLSVTVYPGILPTPIPTSTPTPTPTLKPTPTPTPRPTATPIPTSTPRPTSTPIPCPSIIPPPGLACDLVNNRVIWNSVSGAIYYLFRLDDPSNPWSTTCNPANYPGDVCENVYSIVRSYAFQPGKTYSIWVHSMNSCGNYSSATSVSCSVPNPTPTPTPTPVPHDQIIVQKAVLSRPFWFIKKLEVNATSSWAPNATLTVDGFGNLKYSNKTGIYSKTFSTTQTPTQITVRSSGGGGITVPVVQVQK